MAGQVVVGPVVVVEAAGNLEEVVGISEEVVVVTVAAGNPAVVGAADGNHQVQDGLAVAVVVSSCAIRTCLL